MARALLLLALCPCAFALDPALDVSQYAHTSWRYRDGFTKGEIHPIVQTSDGYLWLGSGFGLFRFDGVKAVACQLPPDQKLPSNDIRSLVVAQDGTLWIGTIAGLASWKNGKLTQYSELAGLMVAALLEDHAGSIWVGAYGFPDGKLCEIQKADVRCHPEIGGVGRGVAGLHEDGKGNLWVGLETGVWRWKPGPPQFYPVPAQPNGVEGMVDGDDGALLISTTGAVKRLADVKSQVAYSFPAGVRGFNARRMLRDRDGALWVGITGGGIAHIHQHRIDVFSQLDGLTGDRVPSLFEDREGNIWAATQNGLDRFRELPVITYSTSQSLSNLPSGAVLAAKNGSVWFGTFDGLDRLNNNELTEYRQRGARVLTGTREAVVSGLPSQGVESLFEDSRGRIWVAARTGVGYLKNDVYISSAAPGGLITSITEDTAANLWIANQDLGLFRLSASNEIQRLPWDIFGHKDPVGPLAADPSHGGLWHGFRNGGVAYFRDGRVRASYSAADGLAGGRVNQFRFDEEGALWIASEGGISRLKDGRIATLTSKIGLPCDAVQWTLEDDAESVWLGMPCGLARVARAELEAWAVDSKRPIQTTVFDSTDGARMFPGLGGYSPHADKSTDGKLWFLTADGLSVVDPRHLPFNKLPPPVQIETVKINGKELAADEGLALSHSSNDLEIDYTALSFTNPDRVLFRYKLEGKDRDWQDVGTRRQAYYGGLKPRNYRFRVMASNNDGVWNEAGAAWNFTIVPTYYQTNWFLALCAAAGAGCLWLLYRLRLRQVTAKINLVHSERLAERTRIARDLHDTLLQSFQGVLLKFSAMTYLIPDHPDVQKKLEGVIDQARAAVTEGRDAVQGLRSPTPVNTEIAQAISIVGDGLCADHAGPHCPGFRVQVEGASRELARLVRDEVYRIGIEALRNAFQHSHAKQIEVEIQYDRRQFRMRIRDDGKGIDPKILGEGGRKGHHGLPGMEERAKLAGGKLAVWSRIDRGTELDLTIPGSIAYAKPSFARAAVGSGKGTG